MPIFAISKIHSPADIGYPSIQLIIHKISKSPKHKPERKCRSNYICHCAERQILFFAKPYKCNCSSNKASMDTHPSMPYLKNLAQMLMIICPIVKENMSQSSTKHNAQQSNQHHIIESISQKPLHLVITLELPRFPKPCQNPVSTKKGNKIEYPIPIYRSSKDGKCNHGIKIEKVKD